MKYSSRMVIIRHSKQMQLQKISLLKLTRREDSTDRLNKLLIPEPTSKQ